MLAKTRIKMFLGSYIPRHDYTRTILPAKARLSPEKQTTRRPAVARMHPSSRSVEQRRLPKPLRCRHRGSQMNLVRLARAHVRRREVAGS